MKSFFSSASYHLPPYNTHTHTPKKRRNRETCLWPDRAILLDWICKGKDFPIFLPTYNSAFYIELVMCSMFMLNTEISEHTNGFPLNAMLLVRLLYAPILSFGIENKKQHNTRTLSEGECACLLCYEWNIQNEMDFEKIRFDVYKRNNTASPNRMRIIFLLFFCVFEKFRWWYDRFNVAHGLNGQIMFSW